MKLYSKVFALSLIVVAVVQSLPYKDLAEHSIAVSTENTTDTHNSTNSTNKDLYVLRAVVYEIGILTDSADNSTDFDNNTAFSNPDEIDHEEVDLTFFNAKSNKTHLDLGEIPFPFQIANVSGEVITGLVPVHLGAVDNIADLLSTLPLTGSIANITSSDSGFISLSSHNISKSSLETEIKTVEDFKKIPSILSNSVPIFD